MKSQSVLLFATLALVACGPAPEKPADGRKRVLTTFTILADMARNVAGDAAVVESIIKPGAEIHDYDPTPQDLVKVGNADLVLWNGLGLERWFERFFQQAKGAASVVLSEGVEPLGISEGPYEGKPNPHAWMSSANALIYVENIRRALSELDPANAETYATNARDYAERIRATAAPVRAALAEVPENRRWLVTSEGAFSYLARDLGLKELYLWPINADEEGTPQQVRRVVDTVRAEGIPAVFSESTVSDKAMRQVAKETGARYAGVLYVDSLTGPDGPVPTYLDLLQYNARTLVQAFTSP
jgi:manganese/iron transport system substrate-binding protein